MSNKRKKGKISEDLTKEYVSLNHIIATKGRMRKLATGFRKLKRRKYWRIYKINKVPGI